MSMMRIIITGIALLIGGWLAFDGTRALVAGDYTTAKSGPYAGQLGPWSRVVSALGLNPRSQLMKYIHVVLGVLWLVSLVVFAIKPTLGWWALLVSSVFSLWYLPIGTILALVELSLLFLPQIRNLR
jgi:hypothetical protein